MKIRKLKLRESNEEDNYLDLARSCENALVTYGAAFGDYVYFNADSMLRDLERLQGMDEEDIEYIDSDKTLYNSMKSLLDDFSRLEMNYYRIIKGSDLESEFDMFFDEI